MVRILQASLSPYAFSFGTATTLGYIGYLNNKSAWSVVGDTATQSINRDPVVQQELIFPNP